MSRPILIHSNSGQKPESAAGGTRQTQAAKDPEPLVPRWLGVTYSVVVVWLALALLIAACLVVGGL